MTRIFLTLILVLSVVLGTDAADKNVKQKAVNDTVMVYTVSPQMHCANCEKKIKQNLRFENGVKSIDTDIENQTVTIVADKRKVDLKNLEKAFKKIGYTCQSM